MTRNCNGFELYPSWDDVLSAARSGYTLWYWGGMDRRPVCINVVKVFRNGKIRVSAGQNSFTLDPGHLKAGLVYRKIGT